MKKILVSDYDQTFYLNDEGIEKNKKAVEQFRKDGNIFVIATGRSFFDLMHKVEQYDFEYDYAIINHGATIIDKNNNVIFNCEMEDSIIPHIKEELVDEDILSSFCCSKLESRVEFEHKNLTKINCKFKEKEKAFETNKKLNEKYSDYINSYYISNISIEIISNKTSKSHAIEILLKQLEVDKENVYTVGDGYSDIQMIKDFNGYCMENSVEELLQYCGDKKINSVSELIRKISKE